MVETTYIEELQSLNEEVRYIIATYEASPEDAHPAEDAVIEKVIRQLAHTSVLAQALIPLLDAKRTKWYA